MPYGVNPGVTVGSVNDFTSLKLPSKMSTLLFALSAAKRKFPEGLVLTAKPVYDAPVDGTAMMAVSGFTDGFQPLIVPSRVAKMKIAGDPPTLKSEDPLKTMRVEVPGPLPLAAGIATFRGTLAPVVSYSVEKPVPLSLVH